MQSKQIFKAVYFTDFKDRDTKSKSFTLAFSEDEKEVFQSIQSLSSHELRKVLQVSTFKELEDNAKNEGLPINRYCIWKLKKTISKSETGTNFKIDPIHTTFRGGKELPLQSWYPYLEGYSPDFVKHIIDHYLDSNMKVVYDPFSGTGTTPLVASSLGYTSYYSEVNPLLQTLTRIKAKARNLSDRKKIITSLENIIPD
ncbi:MAG: hypothetical protein Q7R72_01905, partial [bacterium]|nr:hypothetical protein [bacterium]